MPTKEQFKKYERVRRTRKYNMVTEADRACVAAGLSMHDYLQILDNYLELQQLYAEKKPALLRLGKNFKEKFK